MVQLDDRDDLIEHDDNVHKFITYRLADELYASPLLSIKEVVKVPRIKPVPYMHDYFLGIINLRGKIISVIDLKRKFKLGAALASTGFILVVEVEAGQVGIVVDDIVAVDKFDESDIGLNSQIKTHVPMQFFLGVAKTKDNLINLIKISECISEDDMRMINHAQAS